MAKGSGFLPLAPRFDWLDTVIAWACRWERFNRYVSWHSGHTRCCRVLWWVVLPIAVGAAVWWLRGARTGW